MLAADAILHGVIVARFGVKGNEPPIVFGLIYAALTVAVGLGLHFALWVTLAVALVGNVALAVAFRSIQHETTFERVILVLNAAIVLFVVYLLFLR